MTVTQQGAAAVPPTRSALRRLSLSAWHIPHLVFLTVVTGTLARLFAVHTWLCWMVAPPIVVLALAYVGGLARWDRLGTRGRPAWLGLLLLLWGCVCWALPADLVTGYVWLAIPLAVVAQRMPGRRLPLAALWVTTALLVATLTRIGGGFDLELIAPPTAAIWATVALHRTQDRLMRELKATRGELAARQREAGRLSERARLARDLHDTLAQEIAGSRMLLQAADRDWARRPDAARRQVRAVVDALGTHLAETRGIIHDLTPPGVERDGLETALHELCARTDAAPGAPAVSLSTRGEPCPVPTDRAVALLRVTRGLLANACEHARATHVQVTLQHVDGAVAIEVRDDGTGFDPTAALPRKQGRGFGLAAARDRLAELEGTLTVDGVPGLGTRARATVPVRACVTASAA
ncbi:sensor histidine kinase [Streptomyces sp. NPDC058614]|uniref:sensor histidine kinase n=1 Tax=Streptomyces sp. NPDC058614 TaxID=3346557 RepID=UPI00364781F6